VLGLPVTIDRDAVRRSPRVFSAAFSSILWKVRTTLVAGNICLNSPSLFLSKVVLLRFFCQSVLRYTNVGKKHLSLWN
jgi:hypothetical protein